MSWQTLSLALLGNLDRDGWAGAPISSFESANSEVNASRSPMGQKLASMDHLDTSWKGLVKRFADQHSLIYEIDMGASQVIFKHRLD